jgi:hypothetical protein
MRRSRAVSCAAQPRCPLEVAVRELIKTTLLQPGGTEIETETSHETEDRVERTEPDPNRH